MSPLPRLTARRGKSLVRMKAPGMHSSGPRPKLQSGSPTMTSSAALTGVDQVAPPSLETTASCWLLGLVGAVLPLVKTTTMSPFGRTTGSEPWSKSHALADCVLSKKLPKKQSPGATPLISRGLDHVTAWSVEREKKIL